MRTEAREQKMASAAGPDRQTQQPTYPALVCGLPTFDFKQHVGMPLGKLYTSTMHRQVCPFPEGDWVSSRLSSKSGSITGQFCEIDFLK